MYLLTLTSYSMFIMYINCPFNCTILVGMVQCKMKFCGIIVKNEDRPFVCLCSSPYTITREQPNSRKKTHAILWNYCEE